MKLTVVIVRRLLHQAELRALRRLTKSGINTNGKVVADANNMMATTLKVTRFIS